jgi:outer membrane protein assembly factor BamA
MAASRSQKNLLKCCIGLALIVSVFLTFFPASAQAAEETTVTSSPEALAADAQAGVPSETPPESAVPDFARHKRKIPDLLLKQKKEGRYIIPIPMIGWDPDLGFNLGAGIFFFDNGKKESPFFEITPYRQLLSLQAQITTQRVLQVLANYDQPYILDSPWRVRGQAELFHNAHKNYFGIGDAGALLTYPGSPTVFGNYDEYNATLSQVVDGTTYAHYDEYKYTRASLKASAEYDLVGGLLRPLIGFQIGHVWIGDYTGGVSDGIVTQPSHLHDDCVSGKAIGCHGGFDNYVKLGLTFDTRNFEPDPSSGILYQLVSELSPKFLGSAFNYGRLATTLTAYGKVLDYKKQRVVLAGRFLYSWQFGDVPFYSMNTLAFTDDDKTGLGGFRSIRGYVLDRFIGPVAMLTNLELRWSFAEFQKWKQDLKFGLKPFIDAGRVFDSVGETSFKDWKLGGGVGLNLVWNLSTVINFDYGVTSEGTAFYMEVNHQF